MRLDDYRTSDNVEDQRGSGGGGGFGGGGGLFGLLGPIIASRFGIGGIIVFALLAFVFGGNPLGMLGGGGGQVAQRQADPKAAAGACAVDAASAFSCRVLASTEDTWTAIFREEGMSYRPATLDFYSRAGQSGCGAAQSAMGPFYCPSDNSIYLDTDFFRELDQRFRAAGDFAQAYVIAHEVGHHVQTLSGISDKVRQAQANASPAEGNRLQVKMELQADCYAGVWAARNRDRLEPGDVEEGMRAATAIGDDTLQQETQGRVVPESFTHGTSAQRTAWLKKGLTGGDPAQCDTFGAGAV